MKDTPEYIYNAQQMIYLSMSMEQRMLAAFEMSDELIGIAKQRIKESNPDASEKEIMFLLVKQLYPKDFTDTEFEKMKESFIK